MKYEIVEMKTTMKRARQNKDLRLREKPRKKLHSNDALTGT